MEEARYWRVRMKGWGGQDLSVRAWDRGEVGVWYGAWSAEEWRHACLTNPQDPWSVLSEYEHQAVLGWTGKVDVSPVQRFEEIGVDDWVVVFLREHAQFGLAQLEAELHSEDDHELNQAYPTPGEREVFKYRRIRRGKTFNLRDLPDAFHLLSAQGRGNVHQFHGMRNHVRLLAESDDVQAVRATLRRMRFDEMIDFLGASAWESVCTAYLTLEHGFVPTGLSTGLTLPRFDIVGRQVPDGMHILAQCKKSPESVAIEPDFEATINAYGTSCKAFYFAFGGCHGKISDNIKVFSRIDVLAWVETERGSMFRAFMRGE